MGGPLFWRPKAIEYACAVWARLRVRWLQGMEHDGKYDKLCIGGSGCG